VLFNVNQTNLKGGASVRFLPLSSFDLANLDLGRSSVTTPNLYSSSTIVLTTYFLCFCQ